MHIQTGLWRKYAHTANIIESYTHLHTHALIQCPQMKRPVWLVKTNTLTRIYFTASFRCASISTQEICTSVWLTVCSLSRLSFSLSLSLSDCHQQGMSPPVDLSPPADKHLRKTLTLTHTWVMSSGSLNTHTHTHTHTHTQTHTHYCWQIV